MRNAQVEPFGMMNVDCTAMFPAFRPNYWVSNANTMTSLSATSMRLARGYASQRPMGAMSRDIAAGVEACRRECEYFSVCGGGAPVNKLAENGSFTGTRTSFCSLIQMVPIDLILDAFDRLKSSGMNGEEGPAPGSVPKASSIEPTCRYLDCQVCDTQLATREHLDVPRENAMIKLTGAAAALSPLACVRHQRHGTKSDERCRGARK